MKLEERKFESTSIGFAATSNRSWRLANEFTNFTAQTTADASVEHNFTLKILLTNFIIEHLYSPQMVAEIKGKKNIITFLRILQQFFSFIGLLYNIFQHQTCIGTFICPFFYCVRHFVCHGKAGTENVYNGCRTNAAAEASYDRARSSSALYCVPVHHVSDKIANEMLILTAKNI